VQWWAILLQTCHILRMILVDDHDYVNMSETGGWTGFDIHRSHLRNHEMKHRTLKAAVGSSPSKHRGILCVQQDFYTRWFHDSLTTVMNAYWSSSWRNVSRGWKVMGSFNPKTKASLRSSISWRSRPWHFLVVKYESGTAQGSAMAACCCLR